MDKKIWILFAVVFIDLLGFGIIIPIFPLLVTNYGGSPLVVGLLFSVYSLFQFLFAPILGRLSDKYGRKPVLVISSLLNSVSYLIIFFSHDIAVLFIARMLAGIGGANLSVAQAYIADVSKSHERTRLMAILGSFFGLGLIFGPFVGGFLAGVFSIQTPFLLTFIFSFVNSILILLVLRESVTNLQKHIKIEFLNIKVTREIMQPRNMGFLLVLFFLINFSFSLTIGIFPIYSNRLFSWQEQENGYYFAMIGVVSFVMQAFGIRYLLKMTSESGLIRAGLVLFTIGYLIIGFSNTVYMVLVGGVLFAAAFSLMNPNVQALISLESKEGEQGIVMGVSQSFGSLARVLGPVIGGAIATFHPNLPYVLSSILIFIIFLWGRNYLHLIHRERLGKQKAFKNVENK